MFIMDPWSRIQIRIFYLSQIPDPDPGSGGQKIPFVLGFHSLLLALCPTVLRIRDVYPGSRIRIFHPGSRIQGQKDSGSGSAQNSLNIFNPKNCF
jgi:hypothetical protein